MINGTMFYADRTIKDYREMDVPEIIREYLLTKGTWQNTGKDGAPEPANKFVKAKDFISSGLFVYGLKDNATNRLAVEYYCERWGRIHQVIDEEGIIRIPDDLWEDCDWKNREFAHRNDRKPLMAKTEEQRGHIEEILCDVNYVDISEHGDVEVFIDGSISYDKMAQVVSYLRRENKYE